MSDYRDGLKVRLFGNGQYVEEFVDINPSQERAAREVAKARWPGYQVTAVHAVYDREGRERDARAKAEARKARGDARREQAYAWGDRLQQPQPTFRSTGRYHHPADDDDDGEGNALGGALIVGMIGLAFMIYFAPIIFPGITTLIYLSRKQKSLTTGIALALISCAAGFTLKGSIVTDEPWWSFENVLSSPNVEEVREKNQ